MPPNLDSVQCALLVDELCDEFERSWSASSIRQFERVLERVLEEARADLLESLIFVDLDMRRNNSELQIEQTAYVAMFAGWESEAEQAFAKYTQQRTEAETPPIDQSVENTQAAPRLHSALSLPTTLGGYRLERQLGQGGFGTVYLAVEVETDRQVAVKIPNPGNWDRRKFIGEAKAAVRARHPNICELFYVGNEEKVPYLVYRFIDGPSLADLCREQQLSVSQTTDLIKTLCEAFAEAHAARVFHRDIKPANILIEDGFVPVVTDFGLAKIMMPDVSTQSIQGQAVGTLFYMAPEQLSGAEANPQSDIYSLGVVLYELLTGRRPFIGDSIPTITAKILHGDVVKPSLLNDQISPELDKVCLRAIQRDRRKRFQSMEDFGAAITRTNLSQRVESSTYKLTAWGVLAVVLFSIVAGIVYRIQTNFGTLIIEGATPETTIEVRQDGDVVTVIETNSGTELRLRAGGYDLVLKGDIEGSKLSQNSISLTRGSETVITVRHQMIAKESSPGRAAVDAAVPASAQDESLKTLVEKWSTVNDLPSNSPIAADYRRDLVRASRQMDQTKDGRTLLRLAAGLNWPIDELKRSNIDETELRAAGKGDAANAPNEIVSIFGSAKWKVWRDVTGLVVSPDGKSVFAGSLTGCLSKFDSTTGELSQFCKAHSTGVDDLRISLDGEFLLSCASDHKAKVWKSKDFSLVSTMSGHQAPIYTGEFLDGGSSVATGSLDGTIRIWDSVTGQQQQSVAVGSPIHRIDVLPGSQTIAWLSENGEIGMLELPDEKLYRIAKFDDLFGNAVAISNNGKLLAAASRPGEVRIFDRESGFDEINRFFVDNPIAHSLSFTNDDRRLVVSTHFECVEYDLASGKKRSLTSAHGDSWEIANFSNEWYSGWTTGWIGKTDQNGTTVNQEFTAITGFGFSADGMNLALCGRNRRSLSVTRLDRSKSIRLDLGIQWEDDAVFVGDEQTIVSAGGNWCSKKWNLQAKRIESTYGEHNGWIDSLDVSSDGSAIVSAGSEPVIQLCSSATERVIHKLIGHKATVRSARFSSDARKIISASDDGTTKIWDSATGLELASVSPSKWPCAAATFRPFETQFVTTDDWNIALCDTESGKRIRTLKGHRFAVLDLDFSPDGSLLASSGLDGTIRVWNPDNGKILREIRLTPGDGEIQKVRFTPEGRHLITQNGNGTCYILRL